MTKKKIIFTVLELLFIAIVPIVLVFIKFGEMGTGTAQTTFKIGITGVMLVILVFIILKKTIIDKWLKGLSDQANNYITIIKTDTDEEKVNRAKSVLKSIKTIETIINAIIPVLIFIVALIACYALEQEIAKLYSCLGLIFVSYLVGVLFGILSSREV